MRELEVRLREFEVELPRELGVEVLPRDREEPVVREEPDLDVLSREVLDLVL